MRLFLALPIVFALLFIGSPVSPSLAGEVVQTERPIPPYAKWGQIAMSRVQEKYPQAQIVDYLHIGREKGAATSTEKFKLWLKQNNKEFGVFVDITFDNGTEKIINIRYRETTR
ncbi:YqzG/YhdC family protein [Bacillus benzoevorans]|uniref:DUF3889 domain-containing protein n=1 Tax=Bacillus benzoevorans TaxID=1456 RepID=A0A7X0HUS4_9BACI|nr:YqzG/YhdC family protein [Bacillus benzoevorans]MBB6447213.1 hypothetical protein [Bacillus benzoevorans]